MIQERARELVNGERQRDYGEPRDHWSKVARVWSVLLDCEVSPEKAVLCMAALKLVREANSPKADNRIDAVGYLDILDRLTTLS